MWSKFFSSDVAIYAGPVGKLRWSSRYFMPWIVLAIALVGIPVLNATGYLMTKTLNELGYYMALAMVAVALDLLWGYTGVLCLCMAFFFGIGVYSMGMHLALHGSILDGLPRSLREVTSAVETPELPWHWKPFHSMPATIFLGLSMAALIALVIGFLGFANRVRGVYFAILTQALALAAWVTFRNTEIKLGGTTGIRNFLNIFEREVEIDGKLVAVGGFSLDEDSTKMGLYIVTLLMLVGVFFLCRFITKSRLGRVLIAIRDNEDRLRFAGFKPHHYKVFVFVLAAAIAALGGMLYTPQIGSINPAMVTVEKSIFVVIWVAVGGRGSLSGAILGAMLIQVLSNFLTSPHDLTILGWHLFHWKGEYWQYALGALFIGVVLFFPNGLMGAWYRWVGKSEESSRTGNGSDRVRASSDDSTGDNQVARDQVARDSTSKKDPALKKTEKPNS